MAKATTIYAFGTTTLIIIIGFIAALALDKRKIQSQSRLHACTLVFPCLLSGAVVGIIWRIMYTYSNGVINTVLKSMDLTPVNWLETHGVTMIAIIVATVWSQVGMCIIIFMAGLQSIPGELYEAAAIDGANTGQRTRLITIPMMAPSITINVLTTSIMAFKMYELPFTISRGLPGYSTRLLTQRIYFYGFTAMDYGIGSAFVIVNCRITVISPFNLSYYVKEDIY